MEVNMTDKIDVFTHSSIRIRGEKYTVYIDPFNIKSETKDADFILVTHDHYDHFSVEDIKRVSNGKSILVVPVKMSEKAREAASLVGRICEVEAGNSYNIDGLEFTTVPAYNNLKPFHPKSAGWVGYIVNVDGKRVYIAGDTDLTKENKTVKCDIALVPVGGTYTMDAKKAAELVNCIKPETAIPTHYGSIVGEEADADVFAADVDKQIRVDIIKQY